MNFAHVYVCVYIWQVYSSMIKSIVAAKLQPYWISVSVPDMEKSSPCSVALLALLGEQGN